MMATEESLQLRGFIAQYTCTCILIYQYTLLSYCMVYHSVCPNTVVTRAVFIAGDGQLLEYFNSDCGISVFLKYVLVY